MNRLIRPGRVAFLGLVLVVVLALYLGTLYRLQIIEGNANYEASTNSIVSTETVIAARGNILDRYGRLLVSNRNCNNLLIDTDELFATGDDNTANTAILRMTQIITENGDAYTDELPITKTAPFAFVDNMTAIQRACLDAWIQANGLDSDASAVEVMARMRARYGIDNNYSAADMRTIAGVRYEINVRYLINTSDYVFAEDVSIDTITALMEADIPGFEVQVSYVREYNTTYAAHLLGYTALMDAEDMEKYGDKGYKLNARVGKSGAEMAFEEYLHGTDGVAEVTRTSEGVVTGTVYREAPEPGNHIYLTIDIALQAVAEQALGSFITETNAARETSNANVQYTGDDVQDLITGGALVAVDVDTGEPFCIASYPGYSLGTYFEDYPDLVADTVNTPLVNRALTGEYAPGSTFKPVTALTALCENLIGQDTTFSCNGIYDRYASSGYSPRCTGMHGGLTVSEALTASCNVFFFNVGDITGIDLIYEYATTLGLGQRTGIELGEAAGRVASVQAKHDLYTGIDADWYAADTLQAAIGQSITGVTPIQLARYCAALANSGTVYECSILKSASSYDYSDSIYEREPVVASTLNAPTLIWSLIHQGMWGVANDVNGTAYTYLSGFTPTVAAKTGTTETGSVNDDAVFICYAPADDPEIAVAVVVEKGKRGALLANIAKQVLEYYFDFQQSTQQTETELSLLR